MPETVVRSERNTPEALYNNPETLAISVVKIPERSTASSISLRINGLKLGNAGKQGGEQPLEDRQILIQHFAL